MQVPAGQLLDRLPADQQEFSVRSLKGEPRGVITREHLLELIAARLVEGVSRGGSVKYLRRVVDDQQYAVALEEWYGMAGGLEAIAGEMRLPLETLHRMCSCRKTTFKESVEVVRNGHMVMVKLIQHKAFGPPPKRSREAAA